MSPVLDLTRWNGKPRGVIYRRWVIASMGLRQLFRARFFRLLLVLAWAAALVMALAGFGFGQTITSGGWLERLAGSFGPRPQAVVSAFSAFVLLYPDIVVEGTFTVLFWAHSFVGLGLSLVALSVLVPRLITRDRASQALTIYLARPLRSSDYLLGKFGSIVGVLLMVWTGPLLAGWLLSVLLAPDRLFIVHSLLPLSRALLFNGLALVVLAAIAFGVSSVPKNSRGATFLWIGLWIVLGIVAEQRGVPDWIRHASFSHDLRVLRDTIFALDSALLRAGESLPLLNDRLAANLVEAGRRVEPQNPMGAITGLITLVSLSTFLFFRRVRPA